ncbi:MAG: hypothetical protein LBK71_07320 [Verrucomicrobiales bacterium]|nr:hypothetical protein [Verrucomicrobiales bacterium]
MIAISPENNGDIFPICFTPSPLPSYAAAMRQSSLRRLVTSSDAFPAPGGMWEQRGAWPAQWLAHPAATVSGDAPVLTVFRLRLAPAESLSATLRVSADQRYELFLDGQRAGRGPESGAPDHWYYETYELQLAPGAHLLTALVWWLRPADSPAWAQMSIRPGFLLAADEPHTELFTTGSAPWECVSVGGCAFTNPGHTAAPAVTVSGAAWRDTLAAVGRGAGDGWVKPLPVARAVNAALMMQQGYDVWLLTPATLPPRLEQEISTGVARLAHPLTLRAADGGAVNNNRINAATETWQSAAPKRQCRAADHDAAQAAAWTALLDRQTPLTVPAGESWRVIVDLQTYHCAYPRLTVSGRGTVSVAWQEAAFERPDGYARPKGHRGEIDGKWFDATPDRFSADGDAVTFETPDWRAGRYVEIIAAADDDAPLTVENFTVTATHYPFAWTDHSFTASDPRYAALLPLFRRSLELCAHETYLDCPHYERLMYVGDTRLEALQTYATVSDDRLPRKALTLFDRSRLASGLTLSRFPCRTRQIIPPFSLWWVAMIHDYWRWRDDAAFVAERMNGARAVLEYFRARVTASGLLGAPVGWNFVDWVRSPAWRQGAPPDGEFGVSAVINLQFILALQQAAELEEFFGEPRSAARNRASAEQLRAAVNETFWRADRGLYADDAAGKNFSEHAQALAVIAGVADGERRDTLAAKFPGDPALWRATIYFSHYVFEALALLGKDDELHRQLEFWRRLPDLGLTTTPEEPEPTRSDCHAWGAHPMFHYYATILGVRPAAAGFATVSVRPRLGPLTMARGRLPHPRGTVSVALQRDGDRLAADIDLPPGVTGELVWHGQRRELRGGAQRVEF